jgi:elongation factor 1-beta
MALKLQAPEGCHLVPKILIAAAFSKVEVSVEIVAKDPKKGYEVGGPLSKVPVLVTEQGVLFESNAIARFVARSNGDPARLFGANPVQAAQVDSWITFSSLELSSPLATWIATAESAEEESVARAKASSAETRKILSALDQHLKNFTFLVGERLTLADIVVASTLLPGLKTVIDERARKPFKSVIRWFKTVVNNPVVAGVLGEVQIVDESTACNAGALPSAAGEASEEKKGDDDDDFDVFGEPDEEDTEREKEIMRIAAEAKAAKEAKGKTVVAKSAVVLDIKPWDDSIDLKALEEKVRGIEMEGLEWKSSEIKPIAFGINKLTLLCHIVDDKVSVDDLQEKIAEFEDEVQSTDIDSFVKL